MQQSHVCGVLRVYAYVSSICALVWLICIYTYLDRYSIPLGYACFRKFPSPSEAPSVCWLYLSQTIFKSTSHGGGAQFHHRRVQNRKLGTSTTASTVWICTYTLPRSVPPRAIVHKSRKRMIYADFSPGAPGNCIKIGTDDRFHSFGATSLKKKKVDKVDEKKSSL